MTGHGPALRVLLTRKMVPHCVFEVFNLPQMMAGVHPVKLAPFRGGERPQKRVIYQRNSAAKALFAFAHSSVHAFDPLLQDWKNVLRGSALGKSSARCLSSLGHIPELHDHDLA